MNLQHAFLCSQINPRFKGVHIKYAGEGARVFYKFFEKKFVAQETIDLNISCPS